MLKENMVVGLRVRIKTFVSPKHQYEPGSELKMNWLTENPQDVIKEYSFTATELSMMNDSGNNPNNYCVVRGHYCRSEYLEPYSLMKAR